MKMDILFLLGSSYSYRNIIPKTHSPVYQADVISCPLFSLCMLKNIFADG